MDRKRVIKQLIRGHSELLFFEKEKGIWFLYVGDMYLLSANETNDQHMDEMLFWLFGYTYKERMNG